VNLVKTQILKQVVAKRLYLCSVSICLATIGVCVFRAPASVGALFYFCGGDSMIPFFILCLVLVLLLTLAVSFKFAEIAEMKGYDRSTYFWWCFLCGLPGLLVVIALPERKQKYTNSSASRRAKEFTCPHCGTKIVLTNQVTSVKCPWCDKETIL